MTTTKTTTCLEVMKVWTKKNCSSQTIIFLHLTFSGSPNPSYLSVRLAFNIQIKHSTPKNISKLCSILNQMDEKKLIYDFIFSCQIATPSSSGFLPQRILRKKPCAATILMRDEHVFAGLSAGKQFPTRCV